MKVIASVLFFVIMPLLTCGQSSIEGRFVGASLYEKKVFVFKEDGTFFYHEKSCGLEYSGKGRYLLTKNKLSLNFDPQLNKTIGVLTSREKEDSADSMSTVQVFNGFKHRNDIEFHYILYLKDSIVLEGVGDGYHSLSFYPRQVDSVLVSTFFNSSDSLVLYEKNLIGVSTLSAFNYTLLSLPKGEGMYLGQERNKEYKIRMKRAKGKFKLLDVEGWLAYKLIEN
jgi:hypothetical protein